MGLSFSTCGLTIWSMSTATVVADTVVTIHYKLSLEDGEVIDSSDEDEPLEYLHGHGNIVPGLEMQMTGKKVGDRFNAKVASEDAYGDYDPAQIVKAPRDAFPSDVELKAGMQFETEDEDGEPMLVLITAVGDEEVTIDANHPLAGKALSFDIEVAAIRTATAQELEHGHVHDADYEDGDEEDEDDEDRESE